MLTRLLILVVMGALGANAAAQQEKATTQPTRLVVPEMELLHPPEETFDTAEQMLEVRGQRWLSSSLEPDRLAEPEYRAQVKAHRRRLADFDGEFVRRYPEHEVAPVILLGRWRFLADVSLHGLEPRLASKEIDRWLQQGGTVPERWRPMLKTIEAHIPLRIVQVDWLEQPADQKAQPPDLTTVREAALRLADEDQELAAGVLLNAAIWMQQEQMEQAASELFDEVVTRWPETESAKWARGERLRMAGLEGRPFELRFKDVVSDREIDVQKDFAGKLVVVDFWATWCAPCVAEMPDLIALHQRYRDRGVEFIGISLDVAEDQGGKQKLLDFIAQQKVPWPQYYQGGANEFSRSLGVNGVPAHFVLDKTGRIHTTEARRIEDLERVLDELLKVDLDN